MGDDLTVLGNDGIRRSFDEHYGTMMDVDQDPTGAIWAIQKQADRIEQLAATCEELEAKLAKAVESLRVIEDASRLYARDRESAIENVRYAHECTRRLCVTTLAELSGVSCANLKEQDDE